MQPQFSPQSQQVVARAKQLAGEQNSALAGEAHLFLSVLELPDAADALIAPLLALSGVSRDEARLYAQSAVEIAAPIAGQASQLSRGARKVLYNAAIRARVDSTRRIEPHDILIACVDYRGSRSVLGELLYRGRPAPLGEMLRSLGFDAAQLRQHLRELKKRQSAPDRFTHRAELALEAAHAAMRASFCGRISATHLLLGITMSGENIATETLEKAGCDLDELQQRARASIRGDGEIATHEKRYSPGAKRALERAARAAKAAGHRHIDCGYLLLGLLPARQTLGEKWRARGRELDSVDGLWTAAQAAALRGESGNVETHTSGETVSKSESAGKLAIGFFGGLINGILMPIIGPLVLVWLAIGAFVALFPRYSNRSALAKFALLIGWFCGWIAGFLLMVWLGGGW